MQNILMSKQIVHLLGYIPDEKRISVSFQASAETFLLSTTSRLALGPTLLPNQFILGAFPIGVKQQFRA
jgi:hypothetical protein